jgi:hypothetical protein
MLDKNDIIGLLDQLDNQYALAGAYYAINEIIKCKTDHFAVIILDESARNMVDISLDNINRTSVNANQIAQLANELLDNENTIAQLLNDISEDIDRLITTPPPIN